MGLLWSTTGSAMGTSLIAMPLPRVAYMPVTVRGTGDCGTGWCYGTGCCAFCLNCSVSPARTFRSSFTIYVPTLC